MVTVSKLPIQNTHFMVSELQSPGIKVRETTAIAIPQKSKASPWGQDKRNISGKETMRKKKKKSLSYEFTNSSSQQVKLFSLTKKIATLSGYGRANNHNFEKAVCKTYLTWAIKITALISFISEDNVEPHLFQRMNFTHFYFNIKVKYKLSSAFRKPVLYCPYCIGKLLVVKHFDV